MKNSMKLLIALLVVIGLALIAYLLRDRGMITTQAQDSGVVRDAGPPRDAGPSIVADAGPTETLPGCDACSVSMELQGSTITRKIKLENMPNFDECRPKPPWVLTQVTLYDDSSNHYVYTPQGEASVPNTTGPFEFNLNATGDEPSPSTKITLVRIVLKEAEGFAAYERGCLKVTIDGTTFEQETDCDVVCPK